MFPNSDYHLSNAKQNHSIACIYLPIFYCCENQAVLLMYLNSM